MHFQPREGLSLAGALSVMIVKSLRTFVYSFTLRGCGSGLIGHPGDTPTGSVVNPTMVIMAASTIWSSGAWLMRWLASGWM